MIAVEEIRPGFSIQLPPHGESRIVSHVDHYPEDGVFVVCYFRHGEVAYENRAGAHGARHSARLVLRQLRPLRAGDVIPASQGSSLRATRLQAQLEREQARRDEQMLDRAHA